MASAQLTRHTIENESYAIFQKTEKGRVWMLQFLWGKKDFRVFLGDKNEATGILPIELTSESRGSLVVVRLEYLNAFEWFQFDGVTGHGIAKEEIRWKRDRQTRYLELPKNFSEVAVELACREFGLQRAGQRKAS
ncbi:MAG: hypothetical protein OEW39_05915 [Deltaproteobacteria bacterium]|nr:hypothetical protein [Deltaproteobacteria bacterium]